MAVTLNPIRVGDTFTRTYQLFNPVEPVTDPPVINESSPVDLSNIGISFHLKIDNALYSYAAAENVIVTPLIGKIEIKITDEQTAVYNASRNVHSYVEFDRGGDITSYLQQAETVILKETI